MWAIIDNLPEEFGDREFISIHRNKDDAKLFMSHFKGLNGDSYSCQYYKIIRVSKKLSSQCIAETTLR